MALISCEECGSQISDKAPACPRCGAPTTPKADRLKEAKLKKYESEKRRIKNAFAIGAVVVVGALGAAYLTYGKRAPHEWTYEDYKSTAISACKAEIKKDAHDPSSIEFPSPKNFEIVSTDAGVWRLKVRARARNGFGALRAVEFGCVVAEMIPQSNGGVTFKAIATQLP